MYLTEYKEFLKTQFRKMPKSQIWFERMVCQYSFGDFENFDNLESFYEKNDSLDDFFDLAIHNTDIDYFSSLFNKFIENRNLFKNINLRIDGFAGKYGESHQWSSFEDFDDNMSHEILKSKVLKYQNSILRENKHLANDITFEIFKSLYENKVDKEKISNNLKKINAWENSIQLNNALKETLTSIDNQNNIESYKQKIKEMNLSANIVSEDDNVLILNILDYEASQHLGSSQWCISYDENYWDNYLDFDETSNEKLFYETDNKVFFIIDFKKNSSDPLHKIGITTLPNSKIIFAHDKNDDSILDLFSDNFNCLIEHIKQHIYEGFNEQNDKHKNMGYASFEEKAIYVKENVTNPISYISNYVKTEFDTDLEDYLSYSDDDTALESSYLEFDNIINNFIKSPLGIHLIDSGNLNTIKDLLFLKNKFEKNLHFDFIKSFKNIDIEDIKEFIKDDLSQILIPLEKTFNNSEIDEYITKNLITSVLEWELDDNDRFNTFKIFIHKDWNDNNFVNSIINKEYDKLSLHGKNFILKNMHKIPENNINIFLDKLNNDNDFNLDGCYFTFQEIFLMAGSNSFQNNEFKKYSNIINKIQPCIKERDGKFKENDLMLHNDGKKTKASNVVSSFKKLKAISENNIIPKNTFLDWVNKAQNSTYNPFKGVDTILLKKEGDYNNFLNFFEDSYNKNKKTKKNKPQLI